MQRVIQNIRFGQNLKRIRLERELSQDGLICKMQLLGSAISRSGYYRIELGTRNIKATDLVPSSGYTALISRSFSKALSPGSSIDLNSITLKLTRGTKSITNHNQ